MNIWADNGWLDEEMDGSRVKDGKRMNDRTHFI